MKAPSVRWSLRSQPEGESEAIPAMALNSAMIEYSRGKLDQGGRAF